MSVSPGRRFMIDLLVSSLMADGGLESALNAAITAEIQVSVFNMTFIRLESSVFSRTCLVKTVLQKSQGSL